MTILEEKTRHIIQQIDIIEHCLHKQYLAHDEQQIALDVSLAQPLEPNGALLEQLASIRQENDMLKELLMQAKEQLKESLNLVTS